METQQGSHKHRLEPSVSPGCSMQCVLLGCVTEFTPFVSLFFCLNSQDLQEEKNETGDKC